MRANENKVKIAARQQAVCQIFNEVVAASVCVEANRELTGDARN